MNNETENIKYIIILYMLIYNFIILFVIAVVLNLLYQRYQEKSAYDSENEQYEIMKYYLLDESDLIHNKKPILWIHVPYEYNARNWSSFGSRSSHELNQPYLYLTVKSIISHCGDSFKICLIDDNTFDKLLPNWNIDMSSLSNPMLHYVRQLSMVKLLYTYGGIVVPISFLCFKDLIEMYNEGTKNNTAFICENHNMNVTSSHTDYSPDISFMGSKKQNPTLQQLIDFMQRTISSDFTAETQFLGEFDRWCNTRIQTRKIRLIPSRDVGTQTIDGEPVTIETLLEDNYISFYVNMYGIWIPAHSILKRRKYEWFARLSPQQVLESNFILAKYMLLANAPDSKFGVVESFENKPNWISFWKTPLTTVWGPMPLGLGDKVPRAKL